jgi:hypothetical protein
MWDLWWTEWRWAGFLRVLRFPLPIFIHLALESPVQVLRARHISKGWNLVGQVPASQEGVHFLELCPQVLVAGVQCITSTFRKYPRRLLVSQRFSECDNYFGRGLEPLCRAKHLATTMRLLTSQDRIQPI